MDLKAHCPEVKSPKSTLSSGCCILVYQLQNLLVFVLKEACSKDDSWNALGGKHSELVSENRGLSYSFVRDYLGNLGQSTKFQFSFLTYTVTALNTCPHVWDDGEKRWLRSTCKATHRLSLLHPLRCLCYLC